MARKDIGKIEPLENLGWQQMQVILDKEMPIRKRDRRLAYWWWMSGAAALIAAAIAFNWTTKDNAQTNQPISSFEKTEEPLIEITKENNLNAEELTNQSNSSNISSEQQIKNIENSAIKNPPPSKSSSTNVVSTEQSIEYSAPQQSNNNNNNIIQNSTTETSIREINENKVTDVSMIANEIFREDRKSYSAVDKIDSRINPLKSSAKDNAIIPSIIGSREKDNLSFGGKVFSNNSANSSYTELGIGVFAAIPLSRRIVFEPGIDFSIRPQFVNNQSGADFAELASQDNSGSGIQTPTQSVDPLVDNNSRLNFYQIGVPLKIIYRAGPRFNIAAINTISHTHANQQSINELVNLNSNFALANSSAINSQQWNIHSGIGIDYKVSENASIGINYLWLLTKSNASPNQINLDQNELEIALMYNLN